MGEGKDEHLQIIHGRDIFNPVHSYFIFMGSG
jgi:hypothetical protein